MSWGTTIEGTKEHVTAEVVKQFDQFKANYSAPGDPEAEDIEVCKTRALAMIAIIPAPYDKTIRVEANGSHGWQTTKLTPTSASFTLKVSAVY